MVGMGKTKDTIITTTEPTTTKWDDEIPHSTERYTVVYKTTSSEPSMGTMFESILTSVCTNLYTSSSSNSSQSQSASASSSSSSAIEIVMRPQQENNVNSTEQLTSTRLNIALSPDSSNNDKPSNVVQFIFVYDIKLHLHKTPASKSSPCPASVPKRKLDPSPTTKKLSTSPRDLGITVSLFSRAFPWHFVLDRQLHIVQLGSSLLKLFAPTFFHNAKHLEHMTTEGYKVTEFFEFVRPDLGKEISFETVFQRLNTPFLFRLKNLKNYGSSQLAEVKYSLFSST